MIFAIFKVTDWRVLSTLLTKNLYQVVTSEDFVEKKDYPILTLNFTGGDIETRGCIKKPARIFLNHVEGLYAKHFGVLSIRKSRSEDKLFYLSSEFD